MFDPTGKCPSFVVDPKIARPAPEKQYADEVEYAQLVKGNVSVAPIHSGLDGGMNKVFLAQFPGSIIPLARVLPTGSLELPQLPPIPYADNDGSVASRLFGSALGWKQPTSQTQTLPLNRPTLEGGSKATPATQIETVAAKPTSSKPSTNEAAQNDSPKTEAQWTTAMQSKPVPKQEAYSALPLASDTTESALAMVPAASFVSRWGGLR